MGYLGPGGLGLSQNSAANFNSGFRIQEFRGGFRKKFGIPGGVTRGLCRGIAIRGHSGVPGDKQFGVTVEDRNYVVSFSSKRSGMSCSQNSLKGGCIEGSIGEYYRAY